MVDRADARDDVDRPAEDNVRFTSGGLRESGDAPALVEAPLPPSRRRLPTGADCRREVEREGMLERRFAARPAEGGGAFGERGRGLTMVLPSEIMVDRDALERVRDLGIADVETSVPAVDRRDKRVEASDGGRWLMAGCPSEIRVPARIIT